MAAGNTGPNVDTQLPPDHVSLPALVPGDAEKPRRTTDILFDAVRNGTHERISIGELVDGLGERAFGILLLLFALPTILPAPPGLSAITGLPILLFSVQMILGSPHPWMPGFLRRRSFLRSDLLTVLEKAEPYLRWIEKFSRPRMIHLTEGGLERIAGFVIFFLSVVLILPIPLGNIFPSIAIGLMALAQMERDGATMIAGYIMSVIATAIAAGSVAIVLKSILFAVHWLFG
ncbi:exopolysaccharide biosynthesis protein [Niveispirillum sp. SYP-B3756]|uniref:exopolysaccharide biosynthesis protein n=1 Tax=Niveispirillum sp. SYP-B3756 TaxID=2662178 RepID=UPI001563E887|nr:exopolysaccharide biosynthesis protein [Niveispirillum sp. SYP-B3756]